MIRIDDIELIDKFINEELSPLDKAAFQRRVKDDLEFSKAVRLHIEAVKTIRSYSSSKFMTSLENKMPEWKSGGFKKYSPSIDGTKILLWILIPAIILGISYGIFKAVQPDQPQKPPPVSTEDTSHNEDTTPSVIPADTASLTDSLHGDSTRKDSTALLQSTVTEKDE